MNVDPVRVLVPAGMLGAGFTAESIDRGIALGADVIAIDGGSTDSGPAYLATASPKMPAEAIAADLELMLTAGAAAQIPLIVGSAGTSGTDTGVDWVAGIVDDIARAQNLHHLRVTRIYSEQTIDGIAAALADGKISPLPPAGALELGTVRRCDHVVGLMGAEPIMAALEHGADVVIAGRATDTAVIAALPLLRGIEPGPTWHAAIDQWVTTLQRFLNMKIADLLGLAPDDYHLEIRCYGWNAVLGDTDPDTTTPPREVGALLLVTADSQETAMTIVKLANPYLLHMPLPHMDHLPSYAFATSPAEIKRGPIHEFLLQHVVSVATPDELFRTITNWAGHE
jgi:hypothetical protein